MAILMEARGETHDTPLSGDRVFPDLRLKLPGLFGADAPANTLKDIFMHDGSVNFFPQNTHYPMDYVGIYAITGKRMDHTYLRVHDYFAAAGWNARVGTQLDAMPNLGFGWSGEKGRADSNKFIFHWIGHTPRLMIDTDSQRIEAEDTGARYFEPLPMVELYKKRGIGKEWLHDVFARSGVRMEDFVIDHGKNVLTARLVHQRERHEDYVLRLPLILRTNLINGIQSTAGKRYTEAV